jgi:excisionase family DNA binding protein
VTTQLLTADQVAERWQIPKSTVYDLAHRGCVPSVRLGRHVRFRRKDLEAFEERGGTTDVDEAA